MNILFPDRFFCFVLFVGRRMNFKSTKSRIIRNNHMYTYVYHGVLVLSGYPMAALVPHSSTATGKAS